jgi:hypothetical protein
MEIRMVQEAPFLPPNSTTYERPKNLTGLPLTGIWLTQKPNEGNVHCDRNVVATFLLTTSDVTGSTLCLSTPTGKLAKYDLKPGAILVVRGQATLIVI